MLKRKSLFKPLLAVMLAAVFLIPFGIPVRSNAENVDEVGETHEVSIAVLYDESYQKFVEDGDR